MWNKLFTIKLVRKTISEQLTTLSSKHRLTNATCYPQCLMLFRHAQSYFPIKDKLYVYRMREDSVTMGGLPFNLPNIIQKHRLTHRFAKAYCAATSLNMTTLKHLETEIPQRIAMAVLTDCLPLGPIDATNPQPPSPTLPSKTPYSATSTVPLAATAPASPVTNTLPSWTSSCS